LQFWRNESRKMLFYKLPNSYLLLHCKRKVIHPIGLQKFFPHKISKSSLFVFIKVSYGKQSLEVVPFLRNDPFFLHLLVLCRLTRSSLTYRVFFAFILLFPLFYRFWLWLLLLGQTIVGILVGIFTASIFRTLGTQHIIFHIRFT
jgi:hypothetical protein